MTRNRASAKKAGTSFERLVANHLAEHVDDRIDRRVKTGAADKGDIAGLRIHGQRVILECKSVTKLALGTWVREAEVERGNDDAIAGWVVHKRRGTTDPGDQYVTGTLRDLIAIITGRQT